MLCYGKLWRWKPKRSEHSQCDGRKSTIVMRNFPFPTQWMEILFAASNFSFHRFRRISFSFNTYFWVTDELNIYFMTERYSVAPCCCEPYRWPLSFASRTHEAFLSFEACLMSCRRKYLSTWTHSRKSIWVRSWIISSRTLKWFPLMSNHAFGINMRYQNYFQKALDAKTLSMTSVTVSKPIFSKWLVIYLRKLLIKVEHQIRRLTKWTKRFLHNHDWSRQLEQVQLVVAVVIYLYTYSPMR